MKSRRMVPDTIRKIEDSDLSVTKYSELNDVPFSRVQYYKYMTFGYINFKASFNLTTLI